MSVRLVIASGNAHKVAELARMTAAAGSGLEAVGVTALGVPPDIEESATTFAGNAVLKARGIADWLAQQGAPGTDLVLADDSGICIDAFDGAPGVHSARFAGARASDEDNNQRMIDELRARGVDASPAHYVCVLALARVDGHALGSPAADGAFEHEGTLCFEGRCHGEVRTVRRGDGGFGYDPHFWIDDRQRTFAELAPAQKATRSHRGVAAAQLLAWLVDPPR